MSVLAYGEMTVNVQGAISGAWYSPSLCQPRSETAAASLISLGSVNYNEDSRYTRIARGRSRKRIRSLSTRYNNMCSIVICPPTPDAQLLFSC